MAFNKTEKTDSPMRKKGGMRRRKKVCVFCGKDNVIDYKDTAKLKKYVSERGKILPRRITGTCASAHAVPADSAYTRTAYPGHQPPGCLMLDPNRAMTSIQKGCIK